MVYSMLSENQMSEVARLIAAGLVVGWFQERMEFGPRALGNRSILADPGNPDMQNILNMKIKFREGFRPFAPAVKLEAMNTYFEPDLASPYMTFIHQVKTDRAKLPAITHADGSARIQTVSRDSNPLFWSLLDEFEKISGVPILINTSFNVRGEPIVCTPEDAIRCFMNTGMDFLVLGDMLFDKQLQTSGAYASTRMETTMTD
jgi:carbamoyltransferase